MQNPQSDNLLYGLELGTRSWNRPEQTYQLFWKKEKDSASGKAEKGKLTIVLHPTQILSQYRYITGATYLPKFALDDLDWILENKLENIYNPKHRMRIEMGQYGFNQGDRIYNPDSKSDQSPEEQENGHKQWETSLIAEYVLPQIPA